MVVETCDKDDASKEPVVGEGATHDSTVEFIDAQRQPHRDHPHSIGGDW